MASVYGGYPGMINGSGTTVCISQLVYSSSSNATSVTYTLDVYIHCVNYGYETTSVLSTSLSCPGQTTRTTSRGDCNVSSGQSQKLAGSYTYTFPKTTAQYTRTISFSVTSTGSSVHGTSSGTLTVTIPALTKHIVSYNSNGGSGSIDSQYKYYGQNITLSNGSGFQRNNYTLTGWNTEDDGTGTPYALGATYSVNSETNITLYAQWHMDYIKPTITNAKAYRVANGSSSTQKDDGTYIYVSFSYTGGKYPDSNSYIAPKLKLRINDSLKVNGTTLSTSGTWPTSTVAYGTYTTDSSHTVSIQLYDSVDNTGITTTLTVGLPIFPIDLIVDNAGTHMGLMTPATTNTTLAAPDMSGTEITNFVNNLTPSGLINVADYVTDEGIRGNWFYRKWNNGTAECWWQWSSGTFAPNTSAGGFYVRVLGPFNFPTNFFTSTPCAFFNLSYWGTGAFWGQARNVTSSSLNLLLMRNDNAASEGIGFVYAIGRWK